MTPYNFCLLFFSFSGLFMGLMVLFKRKDSVGHYFFLFSLFSSLWAASIAVNLSNNVAYDTGLFMARMGNIFGVFIVVSFLGFCLAYTEKINRFKFSIRLVWIICFCFAAFGFSDLFIPRVQQAVGFAYYSTDPGPVFIAYTLFFTSVVTIGLWQLVQCVRKRKGVARFKALGVFAAFLVGFGGGSPSFLPIYGIMLPQYNLFLLPIYPFILTYFIFRKDLFNEFEIAHAAHKDKLATIGTLATSVNHEIKNPLYVIKGLAESFRQNYNDGVYADNEDVMKQAYEIMQKAEAQTERALEIMRNFSGFAKQGVSEQPSFKTVNLSDVIEKIIPLVSYELKLDQISIKDAISDTSINVRADERYLEEILFNLIMNSCQAMKQTGGELTLSAKEVNDKVLIEIKDNGPGITKEAQKQIFEPFYTTKEEGTGLGLYITKQLVEKIGGKITINSTEGQGAAFRLELNKA